MSRAIPLLVVFCFASLAVAQAPPKRAKLPEFGPEAGQGIFFENVFEEGLQGPRPVNLGQAPVFAAGGNTGGSTSASPAAGSAGGSDAAEGLYPWSKIISPVSIEDEVKNLKLETDQNVTSPTKFAGGDYRTVRRDFSVLAMLFGIVAEYDGDVRWKESAPAARDLFAQTARNAKVGSIQVFNEAKQRRDQLGDLVNGARIEAPNTEQKTDWGKTVDRSPLMQKLETAYQGKILPWTSSADSFKENSGDLKRHAEIVAAIGEVLKMEGMSDAGDPDYDGFSESMKQAALEIVEAVKNNNQEAASKAAGQIGQACSQCHELYRG